MGCQCNSREFLGVQRIPITINNNEEIDLSLCTSVRLRLVTNTPVTIDEVNRLTDVDDTYCEELGGSIPFLENTKIKIEFDDQPSGVNTMMVGVKTKLVPNPNFLECTCNCQQQ